MKRQDLTGQKFSMLTAIKIDVSNTKRVHWLCKCDCGNETSVDAASLKNLHTKSCGCLSGGKITHGHTINKKVSAEFSIWAGIIDRCTNVNAKAYPDYGGRGITVCKRWLESFSNFYSDMGDKPKGKSIDRIDNNGSYEPDNCRWATRKTQNRNTRRNVMIEYDGNKRCISEWAEIYGIKLATLYKRVVKDGWPMDVALNNKLYTTVNPRKNIRKLICTNTGVIYNNMSDAAKSIGFKRGTLRNQLNGISPSKTTLVFI